MNRSGPLQCPYIYNSRDQGIEMGDRASVADIWSFDAKCFGLTIDAFASGVLRVIWFCREDWCDPEGCEHAPQAHR
jgi:hypothetical protein